MFVSNAIGHTSLAETLDMPIYEYYIYGMYFQRYPPDWRVDVGSAQITSTLANVNRDPKKRKKPFTVKDFSEVLQLRDPVAHRVDKMQNTFDNFLSMSGHDAITWESKVEKAPDASY